MDGRREDGVKVTLTVIEGPNLGREFAYEQRDRFLVGRTPAAHLCVSRDRFFSRHHFFVEVNPPNVYLVDLHSTNGTSVNSRKNKVEEATLEHGDIIIGGETKLRVTIDDGVDESAAAEANESREQVCCLKCGKHAERERARSSSESVTFICQGCQENLRGQPILPQGYRVVRELGRGSMGSVYLAEDGAGAQRAIKLVMPNAALSAKVRNQFLEQSRAQARLDHPRIVRVYGVEQPREGVFCVVMEHIDGQALSKLIANQNKLPAHKVVLIAAQLLEGLDYAHGRAMVHQNIKPANILLAPDRGEASGGLAVKLADFGLAQTYELTGASGFARLDEVDESLGYKAPEQIIDFRGVDPRSDLYAVAAVGYRMLCGELPYALDAGRDPFLALLEDEIVPLRKRDRTVDSALAAVIERGLARRPADRYSSAAKMREALLAAALR